jgi:protein subunit release factor B
MTTPPRPVPSLRQEDLEESFARSAGPGGQHVNKVSTAVTLRHLPSGISVTVSDSRSQAVNRRLARERLAGKLAERRRGESLARGAATAKARRQRARRSPSRKRELVEGKRRRSELKRGRARVGD